MKMKSIQSFKLIFPKIFKRHSKSGKSSRWIINFCFNFRKFWIQSKPATNFLAIFFFKFPYFIFKFSPLIKGIKHNMICNFHNFIKFIFPVRWIKNMSFQFSFRIFQFHFLIPKSCFKQRTCRSSIQIFPN